MSFLIYNLVIFPIIAGMLIVNDDFVQFFLGKDFQDARYAIAIMIFRMFFIGWTNIMGIQILIPHNKNKEFMISTTVPAIVSVKTGLYWSCDCVSVDRSFGMGDSTLLHTNLS